ncbi:MAG: UDP-N-acetylmuramoyl-tripeptide--D-alanyl-D-alanine ligase [Bacteroidota bacterium]
MNIAALHEIYLQCSEITTDSRKIKANSLFFALKGERFDGNQYAAAALEKGAAYAVVDDDSLGENERFIRVADSLKTLQALSTYHRQQFQIPVIAVTGSNGKTTSKELMAAVLSSHYPTHATSGNFNNHIGVPLTLLRMPAETKVAIVEMGMNHLGEIAALCEIAVPTHGLITNIGKAHLEGVGGTIEGVKQAKSELYRYLEKNNGLLFVNRDEPYLWELTQDYRKKLSYSKRAELAQHFIYQIELIEADVFVKVRFRDDLGQYIQVSSQLIGDYNFSNIMTAIVIGQYFKVPPLKIKAAIENYVPANNRSQIVQRDEHTFILDAYNANPASMSASLHYLNRHPAENKIAILGDMLELGENSVLEHQMLLDEIEGFDFERVILVGEQFKQCQHQYLHFDNTQALKTWFKQQSFEQSTFLLKGSRGIRLEQLLV